MNVKFLKLIRCPYCGTDFEVEDVHEEKEGEIIGGCIKCGCSEYPIIEGILFLRNDRTKRYILKFLKKKGIKEASVFPFEGHTEDIFRVMEFLELKHVYGQLPKKILLTLLRHQAKKTYKKYSDKDLSFYKLQSEVSNDFYFKHRFSSESFWTIYPFVRLLKKKRERILDMGCGVGYASFVISRYVNPKELISVDKNFSNLYLLKKYFAKDSECICFDGNYPLPFKDGIFSSVLMMDAFHYINARSLLAREFERVTDPEGLLLLLHLHNSLVCQHQFAGESMPPLVWKNLFSDLDVRVYPEKNLVEDFLFENRLDLTKKYSERVLRSSSAICIVGTKDEGVFNVFNSVQEDLLKHKRNLIINPIYKIKREEKVVLVKDSPSDFKKEYPISERYLPEKVILDDELSKVVREINLSEISRKNLENVENLMRSFVIISVPEKYF